MLQPGRWYLLILLSLLTSWCLYYLANTIYYTENFARQFLCWVDIGNGDKVCRPLCDKHHFSLPYFNECMPWLQCSEIERLPRLELIGQGAVKMVYKSKILNQEVAISELTTPDYLSDFNHGLAMLQAFQQNGEQVVQFLGFCQQSNTFITEYHRFGSLSNLNRLLLGEPHKTYNTLKQRFQLCVDYVKIIHFLHNSPVGRRVMCDSNDLNKTLQQYLLRSDLTILLNDVDALPEVNFENKTSVKCGDRELFGDFVAPEQLWPYDHEFDDDKMPGYDEKTDIWKIPDVCNWLLGNVSGGMKLKFDLFEIHSLCKLEDPVMRTNSSSVLKEYLRVQMKYF